VPFAVNFFNAEKRREAKNRKVILSRFIGKQTESHIFFPNLFKLTYTGISPKRSLSFYLFLPPARERPELYLVIGISIYSVLLLCLNAQKMHRKCTKDAQKVHRKSGFDR